MFEPLEPRMLLESHIPELGPLVTFPFAVAAEGEDTGPEPPTVAAVQVPPIPVHELDITFTLPMAIPALIADGSIRSAFSLADLRNGPIALGEDAFSYDEAARSLTWESSDFLPPGYYELRLDGSLLKDSEGNSLQAGTAGLAFSLPVWAAAQEIQVDAGAIDVDNYSAPALADWNSDGLQDLIVGEKTADGNGKVRVYLNSGTAASPDFHTFTYAQQDGQDIVVPGSGCLGAFPRVSDWNHDGRKDLIVGLADGRVQVYPNADTDASPSFAAPSYVQVGQPGAKIDLDVGLRATPEVVDWNNDGREDLVVGGFDGKVRVYLNQSDAGAPDYRSELLVGDGGSDLSAASGRSSVEVADLNGDGRKDLLLGNTEGQLLFYANVGTDAAPVFAGFEAIAVAGAAIDFPGTPRSRPFVGDFSGDGLPDLLVGAEDGLVRLFAATAWQSPVPGPAIDGPAGGSYVFRFQSPRSAWQNSSEPLDVSGDGSVVPRDVLMIVNELNDPTCHDSTGMLQFPPPEGGVTRFHDTNGDGYCTAHDVLLVVNHLNSAADFGSSLGDGEGEQIAAAFVAPNSALPIASGPRPASDVVAQAAATDVEYAPPTPAWPQPPDGGDATDRPIPHDSDELEPLLSLLAADNLLLRGDGSWPEP